MANDHPVPADLVVWRHPCDCATASRPLEAGEEAEHRFDVNAEPFPWHLEEAGASFVKHGELYLVRLGILPLDRDGNHDPLDVTVSWWRRNVRLGERWFPWAILDGSLSIEVGEGAFPIVRLTMLAHKVDADVEVPELDIWTARTPHEAELERRTREPAGYQRYLDRLADGASSGGCWDGSDA